jgi:PAS domain S-box-containing protein
MNYRISNRAGWIGLKFHSRAWPAAFARYGFAILTVAAAAFFRNLLTPVLQEEALTIPFAVAIIGASVVGGLGPGLFCTVLSICVVDLIMTDPPWQWCIAVTTTPYWDVRIVSLNEAIQIGMLAIAGTSIAFIVESLHRTRRKVEDQMYALAMTEQRFRRAILEAPIPVMIHAEDEEVLHISRAWTEISGYPHAEIPTLREWMQLAFGAEADRHRQLAKDVYASGSTFQNAWELPVRTRAGEERIWVFSSAPLGELEDGRRLRISAAMDVTDHRRIEMQLRELNDTLEQRVAERTAVARRQAEELRTLAFELANTEQRERRRLAQVLHDHLQQLLVAAKMNTSQLQNCIQQQDFQELLTRNAELLAESIDASRSLAVELSPPVLYESGLGAALEWLARWMHKKHGLTIEVERRTLIEPDSEEIRGLLFEVIRELLFNIVKHANIDRASVRLSRPDETHLQVQVADAGVGFRPAMDVSPESAGTGLGLRGIRHRLEALGGRLEIDSAPEWGTRITLLVPLSRPVLIPTAAERIGGRVGEPWISPDAPYYQEGAAT